MHDTLAPTPTPTPTPGHAHTLKKSPSQLAPPAAPPSAKLRATINFVNIEVAARVSVWVSGVCVCVQESLKPAQGSVCRQLIHKHCIYIRIYPYITRNSFA